MQSNAPTKGDIKKYLNHIIRNLPHKSGIYRMKDASGVVIYVGKAKDLKHRVSGYFQSSRDQTQKTKKMVGQIVDIDYTVVGSDLEAIMMETNLIKELRPKYNVLMKDDKNYVYIKITVHEDFPRILITRKVEKDKARYFGPKTAAHKVIKTLKVLKRIFPYRHCSLMIDYVMPQGGKNVAKAPGTHENRKAVRVTNATMKFPCIDYHIRRCIGPCIGTVSPQEYRAIIDQIIRFLEGKHEEVIAYVKEQMTKAASEKKFEVAAALRDKLKAIEDIMEKQRISSPDRRNMDVINYVAEEEKLFMNLFQVREGKLINQENFILKALGDEGGEQEKLEAFLEQYYGGATDLPDEVLIPHDIEDSKSIGRWLSEMKGKKVKIIVPERGRKNELLDLSLENAKNFARLSVIKWQGHEKGDREKAIDELQNLLKLEKSPRRLECYDVSHFGGTETVSSMVVFEKGFPRKEEYRKFKLHQETAGAPNDFASMEETLKRRLKYLKPSVNARIVKVRKPGKKEMASLKKKKNETVWNIEISGEKKRMATLYESPAKKILIRSLPLMEDPNMLRTTIKKLLEKYKTGRIYIHVRADKAPIFEESGCIPVKKIPDGLEPPKGSETMVFDRSKHREDSSFSKKPDLIIIDGGKGQLSSALKALKHYQIDLPIISIAKKNEELYLPDKSQPVILPKDSPVLHLIQHIRDEAHRFAVSFHSNLQIKATKASFLDEIYGLGEQTKMKLLRHFGSPEGIKNATMYELEKVAGKKNAIKIKSGR